MQWNSVTISATFTVTGAPISLLTWGFSEGLLTTVRQDLQYNSPLPGIQSSPLHWPVQVQTYCIAAVLIPRSLSDSLLLRQYLPLS